LSEYSPQDRSDEFARGILTEKLSIEYGDFFDFQPHGEKDKTPDTDGFLRLRLPNKEKLDKNGNPKNGYGINLPKTYFYQLKGTKTKITKNSYSCKKEVARFCINTNLPTLLFVVFWVKKDVYYVYWKYFDVLSRKELEKTLDEIGDKKGNVLIKGMKKLQTEEDYMNMYNELDKKAKLNEFNELTDEIYSAVLLMRNNLSIVASIIYLCITVESNNLIANLNSITGINKNELEYLLKKLKSQNVIKSEHGIITVCGTGISSVEMEKTKVIGRSLLTHSINFFSTDVINNMNEKFNLPAGRINARIQLAQIDNTNLDMYYTATFDDVENDMQELTQ
jgi:hypothetical protein